MTGDSNASTIQSDGEWLLTPGELGSLRATRRLFLVGLATSTALALVEAVLTLWLIGWRPRLSLQLLPPIVAFLALVGASTWCAGRARAVGQDIRTGQVAMEWGRLTRIWHHMRVAEVDGVMFPLQMTPVPALRPGERVRLRFAPRSRLTLGMRTLREVIADERLAGRPVCPAALAEVEKEV